MIDTHTHLYLQQFDSDRDAVMARAQDAGVSQFLLPAIDHESTGALLQMEAFFPQCRAMMGLHPCSVNDNVEFELAHVQQWLAKRKFIAVGEIGLDFYWDKTFTAQQYDAFERQMNWALDYRLPIVIHTRAAMQETINCVKPFAARGLRGVFHCFGDQYDMASQILDMQFLLGIGGVVTYKNSGLHETLKHVPLSSVLLETDAPYLTPVPFRGKRNESSYLIYVVEKLADIYGTTTENIAVETTANAKRLFGI